MRFGFESGKIGQLFVHTPRTPREGNPSRVDWLTGKNKHTPEAQNEKGSEVNEGGVRRLLSG
jgi:hypothetical protein